MDWTDLQWWTAERVSAAADAGLLILAVVTAVVALIAVFQTKRIIKQNETLRTQNSDAALESQKQQAKSVELQKESVERANRPMMTARYLPPESNRDVLALAISNVGKSVAYEVEVQFVPDLPDPDLDALNANSMDGQEFQRPNIELPTKVFVGRTFQTWVPGQEVTAPFWVLHKEHLGGDREAPSAEGIPADQLVCISYRDGKGERYVETFELYPSIWAGRLFQESDETKQRQALEKLSKAVDGGVRAMTRQFQTFLDRTTSPKKEEIEHLEHVSNLEKEFGF